MAHERKIGSLTSALSIATDGNPLSSFCDFVVLVTLQRQAVELESSRKLFEPAVAQEIVDSYRQTQLARDSATLISSAHLCLKTRE